jgi:hypothetical protein
MVRSVTKIEISISPLNALRFASISSSSSRDLHLDLARMAAEGRRCDRLGVKHHGDTPWMPLMVYGPDSTDRVLAEQA